MGISELEVRPEFLVEFEYIHDVEAMMLLTHERCESSPKDVFFLRIGKKTPTSWSNLSALGVQRSGSDGPRKLFVRNN